MTDLSMEAPRSVAFPAPTRARAHGPTQWLGTTATVTSHLLASWHWFRASSERMVVAGVTAALFAMLYGEPIVSLARTWWSDPNAGHGLLLAPLALWMMASTGLSERRRPAPALGVALLVAAIAVRVAGGTAVGLTAARIAVLLALTGIMLFFAGRAQLRQWWLPLLVLTFCIPIPDFLLGEITIPLQLRASELGAAMLEWRGVPVRLTGNVIRLPGHELFVTEACSGLRSLTSLLSLAVILCGTGLHTLWSRAVVLVGAIVIAVLVNGVRVFLTGFLVVFVDPSLGAGFMHTTEGMLLFLISTALLFSLGAVLAMLERRWDAGQSAETLHA